MIKKIYFGGGCFWCTDAVFKILKGIQSVTPGYSGGTSDNPTYDQVSTGKTGHAEVVEVIYDDNFISFRDLLTVFFATHDPTSLNRQGADVGTQYRSAIYYNDESQKEESLQFIREINSSSFSGKIVVTEVLPIKKFFPAENYIRTAPSNYCELVINPKLDRVQEEFKHLLYTGAE